MKNRVTQQPLFEGHPDPEAGPPAPDTGERQAVLDETVERLTKERDEARRLCFILSRYIDADAPIQFCWPAK